MNYKKLFSGITVAIGMLTAAEAQDWNGGGIPSVDLYRDGNVGIGLFTNPAFKLELDNGDMNILNGYGIRFDGNYGIRPVSIGSPDFILGKGGNFGIGITPKYKLDVGGDINYPYTSGLYIGGIKMLSSDSPRINIYLGYDAGKFNTTGQSNTFMGASAGYFNTTGNRNTFLGTSAGSYNQTGIDNTYVGAGVGVLNIYGSENTIIGSKAGRWVSTSLNTSLGYATLHNNSSGAANTVVGCYAGMGDGMGYSSGSYNTFMGLYAGVRYRTGSYNVYLGSNSGAAYYDRSRNTYVGNQTDGDGNDNVLLGNEARLTSAGDRNTILGTNAYSTGTFTSSAIGYGAEVVGNNTMALGGVTGSGNDVTVVIGQNQAIGLGGWPIGGSMGFAALEVNGDILSQGALWYNSDKRFKKNIEDIKDAKTILSQLHPVAYEYRDDLLFDQPEGSKSKAVPMNFAKGQQIGFLAQDLEKVMPYAVLTRKDGYKAVNYNHFFGLLVQGHQEQDKAIEEDKKKIADLETSLAEMQEQNKLLVDAIAEIKAKLNITEANTATDKTVATKAYLEQNSPNPFSENTVVKYFIPATVTNAKIIIRSEQAIEVLSFGINHKGFGNVIISANTLNTGGYTCELYIENKLVDTKKMLLVK